MSAPRRFTAAAALALTVACRTTSAPAPVATAPPPATAPAAPDYDSAEAHAREMRLAEAEIEIPPDMAPVPAPGQATPHGAIGETLEVAFDPGTAALDATARARLDALVSGLAAAAVACDLELVASAENGGTATADAQLSRLRLEAVRDHLTAAGIAPQQIRLADPPPHTAAPTAVPAIRPGRVFVIVRPR